uniref:IF rod domain-containing protein n=1 Tax=Petromyzon marinus TaxID=7757 RepID=S4RJI7_PETMA
GAVGGGAGGSAGATAAHASARSVRQGAVYTGKGLATLRQKSFGAGQGGFALGTGAGVTASRIAGFGAGRSSGGIGLSRVAGGGGMTGLGVTGGYGLGFGSAPLFGGALHNITAPFRSRLGRPISVGTYGVNPSWGSDQPGRGPAGIVPMPNIDPASFPPLDMVQGPRLREKEELQKLNDRFAGFVDRVRDLEKRNAILKAQITMYTNSDPTGPANTAVVIGAITSSYQGQLDTLIANKTALVSERDHLQTAIQEYTFKYEQENEVTRTLEAEWNTLKDEVDKTYVSIVELQTNVQAVQDQITLTKNIYTA